MMKESGDKVDLGLPLGNPNICIKTRLTSERGAGVNAGSRVDIAFAASDPLSELVWSPRKGLSLKCADCSMSDKKPVLLWNVGPSNMIQCSPQSIGSREDNDKPSSEGNVLASGPVFHVNGELVEETGPARSPQSKTSLAYRANHEDHTECTGKEEMNTAEEECEVCSNRNDSHRSDYGENHLCNIVVCDADQSKDHNSGQRDGRILNFLHRGSSDSNFGLALNRPLSNMLDAKTSTSCSGRIEDVASGSKIFGAGIALASVAHGAKEHGNHISDPQGLPPQLGAGKEFTMGNEQEGENMMIRHASSSAVPLEEMEATAESDMLPLVRAEALKHGGNYLPCENAPEASPTNSRMDLYRRKGKEKALYESHALEGVSNNDEGSHGSMESSNSAGIFTKGRKRWNLEESTGGSKRARKECGGTPASTSAIRHSSSFMNWISNMVKGYSRVDQGDPSLSLTLGQPRTPRESDQQDIIVSNQKCDVGCRTTGFRSMFQSLYCSSLRKQEVRASEVEDSGVGSNELVLSNKTSVQIPQVACSDGRDKSSEKNAPRSSILGGLSSQLRVRPVSAAPMQEVDETNSGGNKASSEVGFNLLKDPMNFLPDPLCGQQNSISASDSPDLPSEGKAIHSEGNCNVGSLWIARLSNKNSSTTVKLDYGDKTQHRVSDYSDRTRLNDRRMFSNIQNEHKTSAIWDDFREEAVDVLCKDLKKFAETMEESSAYKEAYGVNYQKPVPKLDSVLPYPECKSSEAMASVFARRLDALKHISPTDMKSGTTSGMRTCLFCGRPGHDLRYCDETTESDLEALLGNINSYGSIKGSSCVCLICSQLGHWANICPGRSLGRKPKSKKIASSLGDSGDQLNGRGMKKYSSILEKSGLERSNTANFMCMSSDADNLVRDVKLSRGKIVSSSTDAKCIASNSAEYTLGGSQIFPLCNVFSKQMADVPKGLFDAIRKLRLTRGEVLKWISSDVSVSRLEGFFLRLRLGKWEAGLGGTGYYVASITGDEKGNLVKDTKNSISVNVGGVRCLVGIQYVSNHDFLEDELVAWWCRTLKNGAKVPSKEGLKSKFEERLKFGF